MEINKKASDSDESSIFMANMYGASGSGLRFSTNRYLHTIPTDKGISGAPIVTYDQ